MAEQPTKVAFDNEESVLRQWEQMHRPPENMPKSGPQFPIRVPRAGLIVPQPKGTSRRHSVISSAKDISSFPLKANAGTSLKNGSFVAEDARRPSEVWLGEKNGTI
jgi:hypothetical protein